jgi:DNA-directed RNA polymerase specialized sigma24 family protein
MAVQRLENLRRLAAHHLPEMAREHQRVLLLFADGNTYMEIAAVERLSMGTVKQRLGVASAEIAMCLGHGEITPAMRGVWVMAHYPCCLEAEAARIAKEPA